MKKLMKYSLMIILTVSLIIPFNKDVNANMLDDQGELRAVWITPITGDVNSFINEESFKNEMNEVLNMLDYYNLNTMIYHVRTHNNAMYKSELNPKATYYGNVNFDLFDPLEWLINETKSRGIEFHAWMNPYRVSETHYATDLPDANPASDPNNLLSYNGSHILNPGLPVVRQFISDTIVEFLESYEVDAIHFDDYFYINLGENGGNIINETQDQSTFLEYIGEFPETNSGKQDWRREQVNKMVELASQTIKNFNDDNETYVQFGISPTGIYKNGNGNVTYDNEGKAITNGSQTRGQTHYSSYLFSDSLKWINEGWLDYILPQSYWASDHSVAGYDKVMGWWNKVVKNIDINLYSGIGLYMARPGTNSFNWINDDNEFNTQLDILQTLNNTSGFSIFTLTDLKNAYNNKQNGDMVSKNMNNARNSNLNNIAPLPELKSMDKKVLADVNDFTFNENKLSWNKVDDAKSYYIYKSSNNITFDNSEIIKVVGGDILEQEINDFNINDNYGIKVLSKTNHLSDGVILNKEVETLNKATIRDTDNALTFYGKVDLNSDFNNVGFYVVYGTLDITELNSKLNESEIIINDKLVYKKYVDNINDDGIFHLNLINIPIENYDANISVVAFSEKDNRLILSNVYTTNINNHLDIENNKYDSIDEMKVSFLTDLHDYSKSNDDLMTFIHGEGKTTGYNGTWVDLIQDGNNVLYGMNLKEEDDSLPHFINQSQYNEKWTPLFNYIDEIMKERNNEESFWGSPYTGVRRINLYFAGTTFTQEQLNGWPEIYQK